MRNHCITEWVWNNPEKTETVGDCLLFTIYVCYIQVTMPPVERLSKLVENKTPLGPPIPPDFEHNADFHELTIRFSTVPLSHKLPTLLRNLNQEAPPERQITINNIIEASRPFEQKQMRWQSIRLDDEKKGFGSNPTGWEHLYMGSGMDHVDIALHIALLGLNAQKEHKTVINRILTGGYKALDLDQLIEVNTIISQLLTQEKVHMTDTARQFRADTLQAIEKLPAHLTTSYYYRGHDGQIIAVGTVLQQLPPHVSMRRPVQWQKVYDRAGKSDIHNLTVQDLQRGRTTLDLLSHGMGSFSQGLIQLARNSKR